MESKVQNAPQEGSRNKSNKSRNPEQANKVTDSSKTKAPKHTNAVIQNPDRQLKILHRNPVETNNAKANSTPTAITLTAFNEMSLPDAAKELIKLWPERIWKQSFQVRHGMPLCMNFCRFGVCNFGPSCRFNHPAKGRSTDEALVAAASSDMHLHNAFSLAMTIIRVVDSYHETVLKIRLPPPDSLSRSAQLLKLGVDKLVGACTELARRPWDSQIHLNSYGLEVTLICSILPRCAERVRYYMTDASSRAPGGVDETFLAHARATDHALALPRLALIDRENEIFKVLRDQVPLPPLAASTEESDTAESLDAKCEADSALKAALDLHRCLITCARNSTAAMCQTASLRDEVMDDMRAILLPAFHAQCDSALKLPFEMKLQLAPFGSSANTVGTLSSDLDIMIDLDVRLSTPPQGCTDFVDINECMPDSVLALALEALEKDFGSGANASTFPTAKFTLREFVSSARVPVLKLKHVASGIDIDLIEKESNRLGVLNTQFIRDYANVDPRVRPLMLAVKRWAGARCVSDSRNGTLSTYCWMLMVIFFLHVTSAEQDNDPSAPWINLKRTHGLGNQGLEKYTLREPLKLSQIYEEMLANTPASPDPTAGTLDLCRLLVRFFAFYGTEGDESFRTFESIAVIRKGKRALKKGISLNYKLRSLSVDESIEKRSRGHSEVADGGPLSTPLKETPADKDENRNTPVSVFDTSQMAKEIASLDSDSDGEDVAGVSSGPVWTPDAKSKKKGEVIDSSILWRISVEDPFELEHDLGSVIRSQIGQAYILSELRRAVSLLHDSLIAKTSTKSDIFDILCTVNENPPDLSYPCHICTSMDHKFNDCPRHACFKCGQRGHFTKECTVSRSQQRQLLSVQAVANKQSSKERRKKTNK